MTIYSALFGSGANGWITIGGTSSATPIWAAMLALVDSSSTCSNASVDIGFANPLLYAVAANSSEYANSFHDITVGNNDVYGFDNGTVFPATAGYDLASGLGSPILANGGNDPMPGLAENLCDLAVGMTATPTVTGLSSLSGDVSGGTSLTVTGTGFTAGGGVQSVTIGTDVIPAGDLSGVTSTSLAFTLPDATATLAPNPGSIAGQDGAGLANIVVTLSNGTSSVVYPNNGTDQDQYTYVDEQSSASVPSVSSVSPYAGVNTGGTPIRIYGAGFAAGDTVTVGGVGATGVDVVSSSEIRATTAAYDSAGCVTNAALDTELGISTSIDQSAGNICQAEVVVTDGSSHHSATTAPLPTYLGALPSANQDGILEAPSGYELTPVPDEFDYVPAPTVTSVGAATTPDGDANADPGSYGAPSVLAISGTGSELPDSELVLLRQSDDHEQPGHLLSLLRGRHQRHDRGAARSQ